MTGRWTMGDYIEFDYNPPEVERNIAPNYGEDAIPGLPIPIQQYVSGSDTISMELLFDDKGGYRRMRPVKVNEIIRFFKECVLPTQKVITGRKSAETMAPPIVALVFGYGNGNEIVAHNIGGAPVYKATMRDLVVRGVMFNPDLKPVRAYISFTLVRYLESPL